MSPRSTSFLGMLWALVQGILDQHLSLACSGHFIIAQGILDQHLSLACSGHLAQGIPRKAVESVLLLPRKG